MHYMEELKEMLCDELAMIVREDNLNSGTLDEIHKITHSLKSLMAIMKDHDYSEVKEAYASEYEPSKRHREGKGRYSRESFTYNRGKQMEEELERIAQNAPDEATKKAIENLLADAHN